MAGEQASLLKSQPLLYSRSHILPINFNRMQAAVYERYGPPEVLSIREVEKPVPQKQDVLIRVEATTVNRTDCAMLSARPFIMRFFTGLLKPSRPTPGTDFAGVVEAVGSQVEAFRTGDRVFGFDDAGLSSQAQYMTISAGKALATMPDGISYAQAAASLEGAHYAYNFINKVRLEPGMQVLVNGATGAIGSAAVQLLKYAGVHVTAVCAAEHFVLLGKLGADRLIDYTKGDFSRQLQASGETFHFVFDAVGKSSFARCRPLLKAKGVYISSELGYMVQNPLLALLTPFLGGKKVIFPVPTNKLRSVLFIKQLIAEGKFTALIDRQYPLTDIAEAYRYVMQGMKTGNVIINMHNQPK